MGYHLPFLIYPLSEAVNVANVIFKSRFINQMTCCPTFWHCRGIKLTTRILVKIFLKKVIKYRIVIGCFHSRGQNPCKFIWTKKKPFTKEKSSIPTGLVWDTNMAAVLSCENALWASVNIHLCSFILREFVRCHFNGSRNHEIHRSAFRVGVHVRTRPCLPKCARLQNSRVFFLKISKEIG